MIGFRSTFLSQLGTAPSELGKHWCDVLQLELDVRYHCDQTGEAPEVCPTNRTVQAVLDPLTFASERLRGGPMTNVQRYVHYRNCATALRAIADDNQNPALRRELLDVSDEYEQLAEVLEHLMRYQQFTPAQRRPKRDDPSGGI